jgi:hypothetical protein
MIHADKLDGEAARNLRLCGAEVPRRRPSSHLIALPDHDLSRVDARRPHVIRHARGQGLRIFDKTCPQYLFLIKDDLDKPGLQGASCSGASSFRRLDRD